MRTSRTVLRGPEGATPSGYSTSTSGYYDSLKRRPCEQLVRRRSIAQAAAVSYFESNRIYGHRKVHEDLLAEGVICCRETVRRIMSNTGLYSRIKRKFVVTTDSNHALKIAENILNRDFTAKSANQKWAADITYIPTKLGWLYLAVVMDLFSRRIVGWAMSENIDSELVQSAMKMALLYRNPDKGLIHHSDRGVQYAAQDFQDLLDDNKVVCSMSRKGNCWDNACVESFFGNLKAEWVKEKIYETFEDGKKDIFNYIEVFYNRKRRHKTLGYVSPVVYEEMHEMKQERAA
ncbi:MAG: IS3 family transposase [Pirellulales bacterium]|nr:IS3 family transposase [Pirellulales bacterium]